LRRKHQSGSHPLFASVFCAVGLIGWAHHPLHVICGGAFVFHRLCEIGVDMQSLLPRPLLSCLLVAVWLLLNNSTNWEHLGLAVLLGVSIPLVVQHLQEPSA